MANPRSLLKNKRVSEYDAIPVPLRLRKTQRSFLNEKKRKSPLYSEQKYLRKLVDLGIEAVERGDEFQDGQKGTFNPKSATSIAELKNEITKEVIEHVRASTKCLHDISTTYFDALSEQLTLTRATLRDQMTTGQERQDAMAKMLQAMIGETTLAASLTHKTQTTSPNMRVVSAKSEQQCAPTFQKHENLIPAKGNKMIGKLQISISEENEQGIRTFTLTGELPKQTPEVTLGWHIADLLDSLLGHQNNSTNNTRGRLIKRSSSEFSAADLELISRDPTLL